VRFRAKGLFSDQLSLSRDWGPACVARLKWMARLDLSETRQIQEGHARTTVLDETVALSVATTPSLRGEGVVVRILPAEPEIGPLDSLGLEQGQLTSGPAGSGRTDLLYSFLCELNQPERKLVTLEEAVRHPLDGVTQVPVQAGLGLGFASALRAILRQDPDVVLLGEMRDRETAAAANRAALSGRLLLATLEARWPRDVIPRLLELGVETACVAEALAGVVHQRTVRTICSECRTPERPDPELLERLGCSPFEAFRGTGCTRCRQTGYLGETVIRELLPVTVQVRRNIVRCASAEAIHDAAREGGGPSLKEDALRLARAGRTTLEEVLRATDATS
jgi:type II secretory ATPase GspE/PulE/Tfp pilus assembly ATPase PilB-like protein